MKRSILWMLIVLMLVSLLPIFPASAEDTASSVPDTGFLVDGVYCATLSEVQKAIPNDGKQTTVTLLSDVNSPAVWAIGANQNVVLDLGGHTWTVTSNPASVNIYPFTVEGELAVKNGTIQDMGARKTSYTFCVRGTVEDNARLEFLSDLTVNCNTASGAITLGVGGATAKTCNFVMHEGVTVNTALNFVYAYPSGGMEIWGGTAKNEVATRLFNLRAESSCAPVRRVIRGGTFSSAGDGAELFKDASYTAIIGGTFSLDLSTYAKTASTFPANCVSEAVTVDGVTMYRVTPTGGVLMDLVNYATLEAAVAAIPTDGRATNIELLGDAELTSTWSIAGSQKIVLDLGGHTLNLNFVSNHGVSSAGDLTVKNGTVEDTKGRSNNYTFSFVGTSEDPATLEFQAPLEVRSTAGSGAVTIGKSAQTGCTSRFIMHDGVTVHTVNNMVYAYGDGGVTVYGGSGINEKVTRLMKLLGRASGNTAPRVIYDGFFSSIAANDDFESAAGLEILGGTFKNDPGTRVPAGYAATLGEDGYYHVERKTADTAAELTEKNAVVELSATLSAKLTAPVYEPIVTAINAEGKMVELLVADLSTGHVYFNNANGEHVALYHKDGTALSLGGTAQKLTAVYNDADNTARFYVGGKNLYYYANEAFTVAAACVLSASESNATANVIVSDGAMASGVSVSILRGDDTARMVGFQQSADKTKIRILAGLDTLYYGESGFKLELLGKDGETVVGTASSSNKAVYTSVNALGTEVTAASEGCAYLVACIVEHVPVGEIHSLRVTPYTIVEDGCEAVFGQAAVYSVNTAG